MAKLGDGLARAMPTPCFVVLCCILTWFERIVKPGLATWGMIITTDLPAMA
jgi:hypothetical protein